MRPKSMMLIVIALGCGLIASIGISQVIDRKNTGPAPGETEAIFVALRDIGIGEKLNAQMLKLEEWPKDKTPEGSVKKLEDLDGNYSTQPLYAGEPILYRKVTDNIQGPTWKIPKGYRVMPVKVAVDSVSGGLILPGDKVDILVYLKSGSGISASSAQTILTEVTVFAVNDQINRESDSEGGTIQAKTVSVLVKPDQAEKLMLAAEMGRLRLSLRRADDEGDVDTHGARVADLGTQDDGAWGPSREGSTAKAAGAGASMLDFLRGQGPTAASAAPPGDPLSGAPTGDAFVMQVFSPDGVSQYHWDDKVGLPRELTGAESGTLAPITNGATSPAADSDSTPPPSLSPPSGDAPAGNSGSDSATDGDSSDSPNAGAA